MRPIWSSTVSRKLSSVVSPTLVCSPLKYSLSFLLLGGVFEKFLNVSSHSGDRDLRHIDGLPEEFAIEVLMVRILRDELFEKGIISMMFLRWIDFWIVGLARLVTNSGDFILRQCK